MIKTDDIATAQELEELFNYDEDDGPLRDDEWTHDGCWTREGNVYRFYRHEDID